jgi:hypothetical protein
MKSYLGIRDVNAAYQSDAQADQGRVFGIDAGERNFVRLRIGAWEKTG